MPNDNSDRPGPTSLFGSITRFLEAGANAGAGLDNLISVLSLLCLFSILNRNQSVVPQPVQVQAQSAGAANPLHKLLGDLTKGGEGGGGGGGISPDAIMSLLPLLNSPQLKSKLNPSTMGTVLGLLNNLGGLGGGQEKQDPVKEKTKQDVQNEVPPPAATIEEQPFEQPNGANDDQDGRNLGRYLNWKNNF